MCTQLVMLRVHEFYFSARICSARCPYPTVGDRRASANAAKVGFGWTVLSQVLSMALKRSSMPFLSSSMTSSVSASMFNSRPMLYHSFLASQATFCTLPRSLMSTVTASHDSTLTTEQNTNPIILLSHTCTLTLNR